MANRRGGRTNKQTKRPVLTAPTRVTCASMCEAEASENTEPLILRAAWEAEEHEGNIGRTWLD